MPSLEESKRQVKAGLKEVQDVDHDAILASLQDEIDRHNADSDSPRSKRRRRRSESSADDRERPSMKFRFKSRPSETKDDSSKRRRKARSHKEHRSERKTRDHGSERGKSQDIKGTAHPFPREPTNPDLQGTADSNAAFRDSLFDALADDEGAAYWESVYSQPIHIYERPTVKTAKGELEEMNDDEYATYVQTKMWEKKHPEIVLERKRKERERILEEEERTRRREEFIRRKERAAWERAQKDGARKFAGLDEDKESGHEYVFDFEDRLKSRSKRSVAEDDEYRQAWLHYNSSWDRLKLELLDETTSGRVSENSQTPSKRIPWPVLQPKPVTRPNIEDFVRHMPLEHEGKSRLQLLKAERFKWHPDKVQQRFARNVDEGTMKIVTGVFQVVDSLHDEERKRQGG